jgi:hypothetical protein
MRDSDAAAMKAGVTGSPEYKRAVDQAGGGRRVAALGNFADAARLFLDARDSFERARLARVR